MRFAVLLSLPMVESPNCPAKCDDQASLSLFYPYSLCSRKLRWNYQPFLQLVGYMRENSIKERLQEVQEGDYLLWNGRTSPQPVTSANEDTFIVEGRQGGRYRFYTSGFPELTNLSSRNDFDIDELTVLRPLSSIEE